MEERSLPLRVPIHDSRFTIHSAAIYNSLSRMRIPDYFIDDLKTRADIVGIISQHVQLKKKGTSWMACCPFHQEKTPSFSVNPGKGFYHCFGCEKSGTVYNFLMEIEGLTFPEAVRKVAEVSGVPLPEMVDDGNYKQQKAKKDAQKKLAQKVIELNKIALELWEDNLQADNPQSKAAREYLDSREIDEETIKTFRIGFAEDSWDRLLNLLKEKGFEEKLIRESGLITINEEKKSIYDRFRGRIIFPVLDLNGDPIAFGARTLGKGEPKYLNSPETPAYIKGEHLYGLFQNKDEIRRLKYSILVEGYLDLIALYQFGVKNCVASLGTAFTENQAKLLGRFARKVAVNYDGDSAGIKAARRAIETLLAADFEIKVLILPGGNDPDDFIRSEGFEAYKDQHKNHALPYLQFVLENSVRERNLASAKQKAEAIEDVMPVLIAVRNPIQRRESFDQAMNFLRVDDTLLKNDLWKTVKSGRGYEADTVRRQVVRSVQAKVTIAEQRLLELVVHDEELRKQVLPQLESTDYEELATGPIFEALIALDKDEREVSIESLQEFAGDHAVSSDLVPLIWMAEPARAEGEWIEEVLAESENCIASLRTMAIESRILEISHELAMAEQKNRQEDVNRLVSEQIDLARLKRKLQDQLAESG
ncbi:MAG: DNA primase [Acidobacteria bacterium]|nr:MAG: DNA primase [Acidobacteriota bacterium]REK02483.1 MAG: DNA primase [Acidobacteriota bacterium]REK13715.1 MAG: DNA primase [Acidobacteriota bacterium]REK41709.1 MAG: DNA primase [Acidobacteriota bacterium]